MQDIHVLYEDNHIIALNKAVSDLVQGDITGDVSLDKRLKIYLKEKYHKPGNVFLGVTHRLDRPVSGVVLFAKTSKALSRMNELFREGDIAKTYWAVVKKKPAQDKGILVHYLKKNQKQNKSYAFDNPVPGTKIAKLEYTVSGHSDNYFLLEVNLLTGRHHQIRCQLAAINSPIKGDLKYGFPRSDKNGGIHLHARKVTFVHPVKKEQMDVVAPVPRGPVWDCFAS